MYFNKKECLKLMQESKKLYQQGKRLEHYDKAKHKKLVEYLVLLNRDTIWQSKTQYLDILESFINRKTKVEDFINQFNELYRSNNIASFVSESNLENEKDFYLNTRCGEFSEII